MLLRLIYLVVCIWTLWLIQIMLVWTSRWLHPLIMILSCDWLRSGSRLSGSSNFSSKTPQILVIWHTIHKSMYSGVACRNLGLSSIPLRYLGSIDQSRLWNTRDTRAIFGLNIHIKYNNTEWKGRCDVANGAAVHWYLRHMLVILGRNHYINPAHLRWTYKSHPVIAAQLHFLSYCSGSGVLGDKQD